MITADEVYDELRNLPRGGYISDEAAEFIADYFHESWRQGVSEFTDYEKYMYNHWDNWTNRKVSV